jgi:hypothetical protein
MAGSSIGRLWRALRQIRAINRYREGVANAGLRAAKSEFDGIDRAAEHGGGFGVGEVVPKHKLQNLTVP